MSKPLFHRALSFCGGTPRGFPELRYNASLETGYRTLLDNHLQINYVSLNNVLVSVRYASAHHFFSTRNENWVYFVIGFEENISRVSSLSSKPKVIMSNRTPQIASRRTPENLFRTYLVVPPFWISSIGRVA